MGQLWDDYENILLQGVPLIDTRAPIEFARGAFPAAVNLPLMDDEQRARVGTCYKQSGQAAAIALGHQLVSGALREQRIQAWRDFAREHPEGALYCFRGGMRSQICQQWLADAGVHYPRIAGGYKAMRRFLLEQSEQICQQQPFLVLAGRTGAAKTELLAMLDSAIDLEALAHHRGSAFGRRPQAQPSQINFENALAIRLLQQRRNWPQHAVLVEDESRLIGRCALPLALRSAMQSAPLVVLESSLEQRCQHSYNNYILDKLQAWQQHLGDAEAAFRHFADDLLQSLHRVRRRLGPERYQQLHELMSAALVAHGRGQPQQHLLWIRLLLRDYYDPMYDYQLARQSSRIIFRGDREQVLQFVRRYRP